MDGKIVRTGHSAEATAAREAKEELGVEVEISEKLGVREFSEDQYVMHYTWYLAKVKGPTQPSIGEPDKYDGLQPFSQSELTAMRSEFTGNTQNFHDAWVAGEFTLS